MYDLSRAFSDWIPSLSKSAQEPASLAHLQSQDRNTVAELINLTLAQINPTAAIPGKTAQFFNSVTTFFNSTLSPKEKIIHRLEALISGAQIGFSLYMVLNGETECDKLPTLICRMMFASQLLYNGLLLAEKLPAYSHDLSRSGKSAAVLN